jgi:hypothetical protein
MKFTIMIKKRENSEAGAVAIRMCEFSKDSAAEREEILLQDGDRTNLDRINAENTSKSLRRFDGRQFHNGRPLSPHHNRLQMPEPPRFSAPMRAYFRSLRAAELAAWESSGGDYLRS